MSKKKQEVNSNITYKEGQNLFEINTSPQLPPYTSTILNNVNGWAGGSKAENVGQVSELIKQFRQDKADGELKDWKEYHQNMKDNEIQVLKGKGKNKKYKSVKMAGIDQGVEDIVSKLEEVKTNINKLTKENIREWLENLVYEKTYCGLEAQELILKDIAEKNGMSWMLGSVEDEKEGIDGYIINPDGSQFFPLQIKSSSYGNKHKQEHFVCPIVSYELKEKGINYELPQNALEEPNYSEKWENIKKRITQYYQKTKEL